MATVAEIPMRADVDRVVETSVGVCAGRGRQHNSAGNDNDRQDFHHGPKNLMTRVSVRQDGVEYHR
jgi:hypothetical protein